MLEADRSPNFRSSRCRATARRSHTLARILQIVDSDPISVVDYPGIQTIFGFQYFSAPKGSHIEVELDFEITGPSGSSGDIWFSHDFLDEPKGEYTARVTHYSRMNQHLGLGQRAILRYSVFPDRDLVGIDTRFWINRSVGKDLELRFHRAELRIAVSTNIDNSGETIEHRFEINSARTEN